jgi:hypothetical protein
MLQCALHLGGFARQSDWLINKVQLSGHHLANGQPDLMRLSDMNARPAYYGFLSWRRTARGGTGKGLIWQTNSRVCATDSMQVGRRPRSEYCLPDGIVTFIS